MSSNMPDTNEPSLSAPTSPEPRGDYSYCGPTPPGSGRFTTEPPVNSPNPTDSPPNSNNSLFSSLADFGSGNGGRNSNGVGNNRNDRLAPSSNVGSGQNPGDSSSVSPEANEISNFMLNPAPSSNRPQRSSTSDFDHHHSPSLGGGSTPSNPSHHLRPLVNTGPSLYDSSRFGGGGGDGMRGGSNPEPNSPSFATSRLFPHTPSSPMLEGMGNPGPPPGFSSPFSNPTTPSSNRQIIGGGGGHPHSPHPRPSSGACCCCGRPFTPPNSGTGLNNLNVMNQLEPLMGGGSNNPDLAGGRGGGNSINDPASETLAANLVRLLVLAAEDSKNGGELANGPTTQTSGSSLGGSGGGGGNPFGAQGTPMGMDLGNISGNLSDNFLRNISKLIINELRGPEPPPQPSHIQGPRLGVPGQIGPAGGDGQPPSSLLSVVHPNSPLQPLTPVPPTPPASNSQTPTGLAPLARQTSTKGNVCQIRLKFGSLGAGKGQFSSPHGFCLGVDEEIIIADTNNHRICVYDKNGEFKSQFGTPGKDEAQLWYPRKIAMIRTPPPSGPNQGPRYVICDRGSERSRMQIFTRAGHFIRKIAIRYIDIVAGLAITPEGYIVAVDSVSPTVFVIAESGDLLRWFDCSEYMREPSDIAISGNEYFICDFKGHCVVVFNSEGQYMRKIGWEGLTSFPNGIDISDAGDILIGDSHGNRFHVVVFAREGSLLSEFECPYVKVSRCCGLKITSEGYVITLAKNNHHVLILNTLYIA